jgi:hypothetical protein
MSGLVPQNVEVRLGPRDGVTSEFLSTSGTLTRAENVVMDKIGELRRRPGGILHTASANPNFQWISSLDTSLIYGAPGVTAATGFKAFNTQLGTSIGLADAKNLSTAVHSAADAEDQRTHDFVRVNGIDFHVWEQGSFVSYSIFTSNRDMLAQPTFLAAGTRPAVVGVGTNIIIFYATQTASATDDLVPSQLLAQKYDTTTRLFVGGATAIDNFYTLTDINGLGCHYDVQVNTNTSRIAVCYKVPGAVSGSRVRCIEFNPSTMTISSTVNGADITRTANGDNADTAFGFLQHDWSDGLYHFASVASTNVAGRIAISRHTSTVGGGGSVSYTTIATSTTTPYNGTVELFRNVTGYVDNVLTDNIFAEVRAEGPSYPTPAANGRTGTCRYTYYYTRTSGGVITKVRTFYNHGIGSKPWITADGMRYMLITYTSGIQPTYFVAGLLPFGTAFYSRLFPGSAGLIEDDTLQTNVGAITNRPSRPSRLPTPQVSADVATVAVLRMGANSAPMAPHREAWIADFMPLAFNGGSVKVADVILVPGGFPIEIDGRSVGTGPALEAGFHWVPEALQNIVKTTVGGSTLTTTAKYQYAFAFTYLNARGRFEISALSPTVSVQLAGTENTVTFDMLVPAQTNKLYRVFIYRSQANPGVNAPLFFRDAIDPGGAGAWVRYTDGADSPALVGEREYTQNGAVLENSPWPNTSFLAVHRGRVIGLLEENKQGYFVSKLIKPDFGLEVNDAFQDVIEDEYGPLLGASSLGERFVFFKRDAVYVMSGDGPDDTGAGTFTTPYRLDGVPGCANPKSIALTNDGVLYQAPDLSIRLLTPGLESVFIGQPVFDLSSVAPVTAAIYEPTKRRSRFFNTTNGKTLDYDHELKRWYVNTGQSAVSATIFSEKMHYVVSGTGQTVYEATFADNVYTENGASYQALVELAWLSLGQLSGYMRTWAVVLIGRLLGAHTISMDMTADFGTSVTTRSVASSGLVTAHGYRLQAKVPLQMQHNTALRLAIKDDSPNTAGFAIAALTLQCGFDPRRRPRLPAAHSMG